MSNSNFNGSGVQKSLEVLNDKFTKFAESLADSNDLVESYIHSDENGAIKGNVGQRLLKVWEENTSTFQDFKENFNVWAETVSLIYKNNTNFEIAADAIYRSSVGSLSAVKGLRAEIASKENTEAVYVKSFSTSELTNNQINDTKNTYKLNVADELAMPKMKETFLLEVDGLQAYANYLYDQSCDNGLEKSLKEQLLTKLNMVNNQIMARKTMIGQMEGNNISDVQFSKLIDENKIATLDNIIVDNVTSGNNIGDKSEVSPILYAGYLFEKSLGNTPKIADGVYAVSMEHYVNNNQISYCIGDLQKEYFGNEKFSFTNNGKTIIYDSVYDNGKIYTYKKWKEMSGKEIV